MKRIMTIIISILVTASMVSGISVALAAKSPDQGKPLDVIARSNGLTSGPHFNLNIHGKKDGFTGDDTSGGHSVFVGLSGNSTIEYVSNKKSKDTELYAIDKLAECFDGTPARIYLPYNINNDNGEPVSAEGYYVFGRILGTPNNGSDDSASSIMIWPTFVVQSCNSTGEDDDTFGTFRDCVSAGDLALGLITASGNLYTAEKEEFVRFPQPEPEKGKGKSKAKEITQLFKWSGYVTDNISLDTSGPDGEPDGYINEYDVPMSYDGSVPNTTPDGIIDEAELINWLEDLVLMGEAVKYTDEWIFDIADLVIAGQTITNDGTKLFEIRFYPVRTTLFESDYMP